MNKRLIIIIILTLVALAGIYFLVFRTYCETVGPTSSGLKSPQEVFPGIDNVNCKNYFKAFLMMFNKGPKNAERTTPSTSFGTKIDTSAWQTYRNEKYGFEFNYPKDWGHSVELNSTTQFTDAEGLLTFTIIMPIKDINWGDDLSLLKEEKINTNNALLIKKTFKIVSSKEDFFVLTQWSKENNSGEFVYWYSDPKGYYDSEEILSKILSTFKFTK